MQTINSNGEMPMTKILFTAFAGILWFGSGVNAFAETAKSVDWNALISPTLSEIQMEAMALQQRLTKLSAKERDRYQRVALELLVKDKLEAGIVDEELRTDELEVLTEKPGEKFPEALEFWQTVKATKARFEEHQAKVDPALNGQRIRLPGYVLPLEFEGENVREFLLVPVVGACIHVPPPPPNQMVFVKSDKAFSTSGLYTPVWVEGILSTDGGSHDLSLVDGQAPVDVGYTMEHAKVEPYEQ